MTQNKTNTLFNYIGGKTWLKKYLREAVSEILEHNKLTDYVEPFAGGLGAFLNISDILIKNNINNILLNDINLKLINFYFMVKENPKILIRRYMDIENEYFLTVPKGINNYHKTKDKDIIKSLLTYSEAYFKEMRNVFNENTTDEITSAACLLFLQNHCFNGVYRENSKGKYNTPFNWEGKYYSEELIDKKIINVHNLFKQFNINFSAESFEKLDYNNNSLYYIDPPYVNEIEALENQYNKDSFNIEKQKQLIKIILPTIFIYSNHDNELLINAFEDVNVDIKKIPRKNIISAYNESRKNDKIEILVSKL